MQADPTLNLLIALDNSDRANQLMYLLRDAGYVLNSHVVEENTDLDALINRQQCDLLLTETDFQALDVRQITSKLKKQQPDVAVVMMSSAEDPARNATVEGLRMGADYVVPTDEDQYFLLAVANSLDKVKQQRKRAAWKQLYLAAESRCEGMMDNNKDAVAIVQEGTFVYVNPVYSRLFGFEDPGDMLMLPVIDTIGQSSQGKLKAYLKPLSAEDNIESTSLNVTGLTLSGEDFDTTLNITQVLYQSEPALQFLVSHTTLSPEITGVAAPGGTGSGLSDIQPKKVLAAIDQAILKAARTEEQALAVYIRIDQMQEFKSNSDADADTNSAEMLLDAVYALVARHTPRPQVLLKFADDVIVAVHEINSLVRGRQYAEELSQAIAAQTFSVGEESLALSASICVSALNHTNQSAVECLRQCQQAIAADDSDLDKTSSSARIHSFDNIAFDRFESEKATIEFGRLLLEKRLIGIAFQPIMALQGKPAEFYEVLMRPKVEEYPYEVPEDFIERVFKTPVAGEIDRWVILESVKALAEKLKKSPKTKLFINLSAASIQDPSFAGWLKIALQTAKLGPSHLIFQLREIDVGRYIDQAARLIKQMAQLGVQTALTHFGLAINPVLVLEKLPVNFVKLDRVLVKAALEGGEGVRGMINLLSVTKNKDGRPALIVPFVENPSIMPTLWDHGVDYIQGFYVDEPRPGMDFDFVENN